MSIETVEDPGDPRIADYVGLRDGPNNELAIVEGLTALDQLVRSPYPIRSVLCLPKRLDRVRAALADHREIRVLVAEEPVLKATVGFNLHRGVVAAAERLPPADPIAITDATNRVAVLERVNDLENLGSLFRSAAAFNIGAVLLDPECADPLYRRPIRVSMGHVLRVPFARFAPDQWPDSLDELRASGFTVVALTPAADAVDLRDVRAPRVAFLLGAEGPGLTSEAMNRADVRARIAIAPDVDSLNVATAAAVAFHTVR